VEGAVENAPASASVEQVGKYIPIAELGRGGMATAYLSAISGPGGFNKLMVVKRLRPALAAEPDASRPGSIIPTSFTRPRSDTME
jgi:hypothetical protein